MAWRIDQQVVRGEIDNRTRGHVSGRIWLVGREEPIELALDGNPWRDLAGHVLRFENPRPEARDLEGLVTRQVGVVGDMSASRKVKVPECSADELQALYAARKPIPYRWGNALHLEWFSERNGRVVLESAGYKLQIGTDAAWEMTPEEESRQRLDNAKALTEFMQHLGLDVGVGEEANPDELDDAPRSSAEAEADDEAARMDLLLDRVTARLEGEGEVRDPESFDRILKEERARLRRERGEPEEEPTPKQEAERDARIEEMNAISAEVAAEIEAEKWKGGDPVERRRPPLVERCSNFAVTVHRAARKGAWIPENAQREHPVIEIINGIRSASAKLAGALGMGCEDEQWPPPALYAGDTLVRLKKARAYLRDALRGLDSADEEHVATPQWRAETRTEAAEILGEVQTLITELRDLLQDEEE